MLVLMIAATTGNESPPRPKPLVPSRATGKSVGGFLYVHRSAIGLLDGATASRIASASSCAGVADWNVAKVSAAGVSLLLYEDFDASAFPALLTAYKVYVGSGVVVSRDYRNRPNPPILHRKERLLRPDDPAIPSYAALTRQAEGHGLFENVRVIGTLRRWQALIAGKGLVLDGHALRPAAEDMVTVERHKTAIARRELSQPVALMVRLGMLAEGTSIFDYGCGQGDDVAALVENGFEAFGWDPYHVPGGPRRAGDLVNLGFVVNVIEDPEERSATVRAAWGFARRALVVSAMGASKAPLSGLRPYRDGYLTTRGTFQRYYSQDGLKELVASATGRRAMSLAPGIVAIFRDEGMEQEVAFRRRSRAQQLADRFVRRDRPASSRQRASSPTSLERVGEQVEVLRELALEFGRLPDLAEVPAAVLAALAKSRVSFERAIAACREAEFLTALRDAAEARKEDLLVHFAMTLFPGVPKYTTLPRSLQRDVRTFFGSHAAVRAEATRLLFSAGDPVASEMAIEAAAQGGLGAARGGVFRFRPEVLDRLPVGLRVLVGCAEVVHPDLSEWDFIELQPSNKRVRAFRCEDAAKAIPRISEVAEVDLVKLRSRRVKPSDAVLYLKATYMRADDPGRDAQAAVDGKLLDTGIVDEDGKGPSASELTALLRPAGRGP